jgi:hypothetical protein
VTKVDQAQSFSRHEIQYTIRSIPGSKIKRAKITTTNVNAEVKECQGQPKINFQKFERVKPYSESTAPKINSRQKSIDNKQNQIKAKETKTTNDFDQFEIDVSNVNYSPLLCRSGRNPESPFEVTKLNSNEMTKPALSRSPNLETNENFEPPPFYFFLRSI